MWRPYVIYGGIDYFNYNSKIIIKNISKKPHCQNSRKFWVQCENGGLNPSHNNDIIDL